MGDDSYDDSSDSSDDEEELPERGINFNGFKNGLKRLGIDQILTRSEIEHLFDHMVESSREYGINAVDFCYFLKQNTITLQPKLATIQRKVVSTLAKQQDKEDKEEKKINEINLGNDNDKDNDKKDNNDNKAMIISVSQLDLMKEEKKEEEEEEEISIKDVKPKVSM